eukprot:TRINITY_DN22951_c0_g1_i1.p1 TRINITY_DN22951_c0_g1~~TRINITY_DN22951_c0_g1_i1.p1  ORF type:complete len:124 (-),score=37.96 TRINITY_DN22951_c0_g1_i1:190-561(-)
MVVKAGQNALVSAVEQTEEQCKTQIETAIQEAAKNATEESASKTDYKIKEAEDRVKREWGKDLVNLRKLFQDKMEETRKQWVGEMIEIKKSFTNQEIRNEFKDRNELNKISSESFILFDEGSS